MSLIRLRGGTEYEWDTAGPTLRAREVGVTTDTHRLKVGDGVNAWADLPWVDAQAGLVAPYVAKSATYTVGATDRVINCTANTFTVSLPPATTAGRVVQVKNSGTGVITIDGDGSELIEGSLTQTLHSHEALDLCATGTGWVVL